MGVCSYVVRPVDGQLQGMVRRIQALERCEVRVAENREVAILVTDTDSDSEEQALQAQLREIEQIQFLALTFGELQDDNPTNGAGA